MHMLQTAAPSPGPFEHLLEFFVVEAVDEWVEGWDDKGVEYICHLVAVQGIAGAGTKVHENECPIQWGHSCEVGATGKGCSPASLDQAHVHHSASNEPI